MKDAVLAVDFSVGQSHEVEDLLRNAKRKSWPEYERLKQIWREAHPEATPQQYGAAMRRLSFGLGL